MRELDLNISQIAQLMLHRSDIQELTCYQLIKCSPQWLNNADTATESLHAEAFRMD